MVADAVTSGTILLTMTAIAPDRAIGRSPDDLTLDERWKLAGKYVALEIYSPATLPMRRIEAIGDSLAACVRMLKNRGLDPARFEFTRLAPPY
jgi:hypothetical protein